MPRGYTIPKYQIRFNIGSIGELNKGIMYSVWLSSSSDELIGYIRHSTGSDSLQDHLFWFQRSDVLNKLFGPSYPDIKTALKSIRQLMLNPTNKQLINEQNRRTGKWTDYYDGSR